MPSKFGAYFQNSFFKEHLWVAASGMYKPLWISHVNSVLEIISNTFQYFVEHLGYFTLRLPSKGYFSLLIETNTSMHWLLLLFWFSYIKNFQIYVTCYFYFLHYIFLYIGFSHHHSSLILITMLLKENLKIPSLEATLLWAGHTLLAFNVCILKW